MSDKIAWWVELNITTPEEIYEILNSIQELRIQNAIPDVFITTQHPEHVSFGASPKRNVFSPELLAQVENKHGNTEYETVVKYLDEKGIPFSHNKNRGGGANYYAPGQQVYYFFTRIGSKSDFPTYSFENVGEPLDYSKKLVNQTLLHTAYDLFPTMSLAGVNAGVRIGSNDHRFSTNDESDLTTASQIIGDETNRRLKIASKGVAIKKNDTDFYSVGGFLFFVKPQKDMTRYVFPCGLEPDKFRVCSLEELRKDKISYKEVHASVQKSLKTHFGYSKFEVVSKEGFEQFLAQYH